MNAGTAAGLASLVDDYADLAAMTGSDERRRLIRDAQAQLRACLDGYLTARVGDDEAAAWLDAGRLTLARLRVGQDYLDETLDRIRLARRL